MIDLRTDALTPPTEAMWEAMRRAELGWAMRGEDRSVEELQRLAAHMVGKEAALFTPTCSMANLLALLTLGERGTQVILEATTHTLVSEEWGVSTIAGLFPRPVQGAAGAPDPIEVDAAIRETLALGLPRTSLLCLENSHNNAGGAVITPTQTEALAEVAHRHGATVHLDGARLFNAAIALSVAPSRLTEAVDTVSISLNKGLSAPWGALLCGRREVIQRARAHARVLGVGSIHKAGICAAAGLIALTQMVERLAEDNRRAGALAAHLADVVGLQVDPRRVRTNIVLADVTAPGVSAGALVSRLAQGGVLALERAGNRVRFVIHRLIGDAEVSLAALKVAETIGELSGCRR